MHRVDISGHYSGVVGGPRCCCASAKVCYQPLTLSCRWNCPIALVYFPFRGSELLLMQMESLGLHDNVVSFYSSCSVFPGLILLFLNCYFPVRIEIDDSSGCSIRLDCRELYERIFSGIQETKSLQVTVASFKLLHDLDLVSIVSFNTE